MSQQHVDVSSGAGSIYDERPWLGHYPAGTPHEFDLPDVTIPDFLRDTAAGLDFDVMLEAKAKDLALLRLRAELAQRGLQSAPS